MKDVLTQIAILIGFVAFCYIVGFLVDSPPHEIAVWAVVGYLIGGFRKDNS